MNQFTDTINKYEELLIVAIMACDEKKEGVAYSNLGFTYYSVGKYQEAIQYFKKHLNIAIKIGDKNGEAAAYGNLGAVCHPLGKYQEAIRYQEKRLCIAIEIGDKNGEGTAYGNLGVVYQSIGKYQEAIKYQEKSLIIAKEINNKNGEGKAYGNLGAIYLSTGKYQEAIRCQEKRLIIAIEIDDKDGEGTAYGNLGVVYQSLGKYQEAIKYHDKLLNIAIKIGDKKSEGITYGNLGVVYQLLGKYREATMYQEKHLRIAIEIGDKSGQGAAYGNLGVISDILGKYQEAIEYQEKSLGIAIEIGDRSCEGAAYGNLGEVHQLLGKYQEAMKYLEKRLNIAIEIGDKIGLGEAYGSLGVVYRSLGNYKGAIKYQEKLLNIATEIGDINAKGTAYENLGVVYQLLGKYQEAIRYFEKRLSISIEIGNRNSEGTAYGNLGIAYQSLGKYQEAIKYHDKLLNIAIEIGDKKSEGEAYGNLGAVYQSLGKYREALMYHEKHLRIAIETSNKNGEGIALHNLGYLYRNLYNYHKHKHQENHPDNMNKAANYFKDALQCYEWMFSHLKGQDKFKISIVDRFIVTYQALTQVLIELNQIEDALLVSERGRARALGDLLVSRYSLGQGDDSTSNMTYDDVKALLTNKKLLIRFFALSENFTEIDSWCLTYQSPPVFHQGKIRQLNPTVPNENEKDYVQLSLSEIVEGAFDKLQVRAAVDCEDRSLDLLEENEGEHENRNVAEQPKLLTGQATKEAPREVNTSKENPRPRCLWPEEEEDPLELLYEHLIVPVQQDLTQAEIVVIPDGLLFKVPFAALRDPNTKLYLSDIRPIRLAPSLTTLKALQESPEDRHNRTGALIVGNPAVEEVMIKREKKRFPRLPAAEGEAKNISKLMGVMPLLGAQATKEAIKGRLRDGVGVVHIAAHGSSKGKILLAPCRSGNRVPEEEDCMLTMKEVQETGCRAQLVVLSCCHSGRGEIRAEGVVGLTRAFLAAGARAVVASLWAIDDEATREFMLSFYSHLKVGESASVSLQQAMKEMRMIRRYKEPRYWTAFFLIGDDVRIVHQTIFTYALRRIFAKPHNLVSPSPGHIFAI